VGRPPYPRDERGAIVRPGDPRYEELKRADANNGVNQPPATGDRRLSDTGRRIINRAKSRGANRATATGNNGQETEGIFVRDAQNTGTNESDILIESPAPRSGKDAATPPKSKRSGAFKPEHVSNMVCAGFGVLAVGLQRPWWGVTPDDKRLEVDPWAPAGAELLNKYVPDGAAAEKLLDGFAAGQVILGISMMVGTRLAHDNRIRDTIRRERLEAARANADELRQQEGLPAEPAPVDSPSQNGHVTGSGAAPVGPMRYRNVGGDFTPGL
jgi:hypothetical protein